MSFTLPPLADKFIREPMDQALREIEASPKAKQKLLNEALRLHRQSASHQTWRKYFEAALWKQHWDWPRCRDMLVAEGVEPTPEEMLDVLISWLIFTAHKLNRREEIREVLQTPFQHRIFVDVFTHDDTPVAPCGCRNNDQMEPSPENLERMPPCGHLRCACNWTAQIVFPD